MSSTVVTNAWIEKVADALQSDTYDLGVAYFRIGEGGWSDVTGTKVARVPDPTLTNLDSIVNPSRYPADARWTYQKAIVSAKITEVTTSSVRVECLVDTSEANLDSSGFSPEFWELGIFDGDGTMISHTTFSRQPKDDTVALRHYITIAIARA